MLRGQFFNILIVQIIIKDFLLQILLFFVRKAQ